MTESYSEIPRYGKSTEYSNSEIRTFYFVNLQQSNLYEKANDANISSVVYSGLFGFVLMIILVIIIISYGLFYFIFPITQLINKIFLYLFIFWVILLLFHIYNSYNLDKNAFNLRQKVIKEIPNKTM